MNTKLMELLNEYHDITKIMLSAIRARHIEIFESQVKLRRKCLDLITEEEKTEEEKNISKDLMIKIKSLEEDIERESVDFKKELELENNSTKVEFSAIKKSNEVSNKYRYANSSQQQSRYIDQKK